MKKHYRFLALLVCVALAGGLLGGCATSGVQNTPTSEAPSSSNEEASAEGVTLDYTAMWSEGETHTEWLRQMIAEYEEVSGNKINISFAGRDVLNKIKSRILAGDAPDIVDQDGSEIAAALLGSEIMALPLDDILDAPGSGGAGTLREAFSPEALKLYQKDDQTYFIPFNYTTSGFFYDKTLFQKVGVEAPKTWEEFLAAGNQFKEAGIPFLAQDGTIGLYNAYYYYWATQRVMGTGKLLEAATDKTGAAWDDPGYLQAAQMVHSISKGDQNFFQDGYEGSGWPNGQGDWAMGNAGAVLNGAWLPNEVKDMVSTDWNWGFFPFPTVEGGAGKVTDMEAYYIGWTIPKGAKNPDAAKEFFQYASSQKSAQALVDTTLNMSARMDVGYPGILAEVEPYLSTADTFFLSYDGILSEASQWWADVFSPLSDGLLHGTITPEDFISQIKANSIAFYENK